MMRTDEALLWSVHHYLEQANHLLAILEKEPEANALIAMRLAPDSFDTGFHLAVAIQFAARALCLPAGAAVPEIEEPHGIRSLSALHVAVAAEIAEAPTIDWTARVKHSAGEAQLDHSAAEYVARFALPNMLFHLTMAYAGLRHGGLELGKADFDGMHVY